MDDIELLGEDLSKLQVCLDRLNDGLGVFSARFASSKCEML